MRYECGRNASSQESKEAALHFAIADQIRSEHITGVPHRLATTYGVLRMFRRPSSWSSHIVPNRPHRAIPLVLSSAGKTDEDWCFESNILLKASFSALLVVFCRYSSHDLYQTKRPASKRSHECPHLEVMLICPP